MPDPTSPDIARMKVIQLFLDAAIQLARVSGVGLDELREHLEVGYYEHLRQRSLSIAQIAKRLGKSDRTVSQLATRWKHGIPLRNPLHLLRRDLLARLTEGPVAIDVLHESLWRNYAKLVSDPFPLNDIVAELVESGIVHADESAQTVTLASDVTAFGAAELESQLVGLRDLLAAATHVAHARFFSKKAPVVRVFSLQATTEQLSELANEMYELFLQRLKNIDLDRRPGARTSAVFFGVGVRSRELE